MMLPGKQYRSKILELEHLVAQDLDFDHIATHIGYGAESLVYRLNSDKDVVVKLPVDEISSGEINRDSAERQTWTKKQQQRLIRGLGSYGLEQLVEFYDCEPAAILTRYAGSRNLNDMMLDDSVYAVTQKDCEGLLITAARMHERGLSIDNGTSNLVHCQNRGFTLIDYKLAEEKPQTLNDKILEIAGMLIDSHFEGPPPPQFLELRKAVWFMFGSKVLSMVDSWWYAGNSDYERSLVGEEIP